MLPTTITVAIVDDQTLFRKMLKNYISEQKGINVVIQSPNIPDLLKKLKDYQVDILLLDVHLPQPTVYEAIKLIKELYPGTKILILTTCTDMAFLSELLHLDVAGYICHADEPEDLLHAIAALSAQRIYRSKLFTELLYWNKYNNQANGNQLPVLLNEREKELIRLLWQEKSNKEIADLLFIGIRSVEKIRQNLKEKIGVKSTVGLLKFAINQKIISVTTQLWDNSYKTIKI